MDGKRSKASKLVNLKKLSFLLLIVASLLVIRFFLIYKVIGESMSPTLSNGSYVIILPAQNLLEIDEIVLFKKNAKQYIKRVIAFSNDTLEMKDSVFYINDKKTELDFAENNSSWHLNYISDSVDIDNYQFDKSNWGPVIVPKNYFFLIGDNQKNSRDSRHYGFIHQDEIIGKVFYSFSNSFGE